MIPVNVVGPFCRPVQMGFLVDIVALGHVSPVIIFWLIPLTQIQFIYNWHYLVLETDSVVR